MSKYQKMKKLRMPDQAVRNKMKMDAVDAYWIRDFFGEPQPTVRTSKSTKKKVKKSKLKALHWMKLKNKIDINRTIWGQHPVFHGLKRSPSSLKLKKVTKQITPETVITKRL